MDVTQYGWREEQERAGLVRSTIYIKGWRVGLIRNNSKLRVSNGYLPSLDGWRAIAVVLVCFFHDRVHRTSLYSTSLLHKYSDRGVDLFFAISGVLICTRLLQEEVRFGGISLKNFYLRRVCRIQPAALTYLISVGILALFAVVPLSLGGFLSATFLFPNFYPFHGGLNDSSALTNHFWSLSIEEHFYLLLPLFLVLVKRRRIQWLPGVQFWQIRYLWLLLIAALSYGLTEKSMIRLGHHLAPPASPGRQDL